MWYCDLHQISYFKGWFLTTWAQPLRSSRGGFGNALCIFVCVCRSLGWSKLLREFAGRRGTRNNVWVGFECAQHTHTPCADLRVCLCQVCGTTTTQASVGTENMCIYMNASAHMNDDAFFLLFLLCLVWVGVRNHPSPPLNCVCVCTGRSYFLLKFMCQIKALTALIYLQVIYECLPVLLLKTACFLVLLLFITPANLGSWSRKYTTRGGPHGVAWSTTRLFIFHCSLWSPLTPHPVPLPGISHKRSITSKSWLMAGKSYGADD